MRRIPLVLLTALALVAAGCITPANDDLGAESADPAEDAREAATHVLEGAAEPDELTAPAWRLLGEIADGGPVYGAGEPGIWAHTDGTLYLAFPGCDTGPYLVQAPDQPHCEHGPIYRSDDGGDTWTRLNAQDDGRLADEGPAANGDNDVTVDADGTVYASNLGGGIQVFKSTTRGANWTYVGDVVPPDAWADRQWMAAAHPGHLIMTWMGGADGNQRAVAVNTTFDGGATWTGTTYLGEQIGWIGTVQFAPDGHRAFVPFTQWTSEDGGGYDLRVAVTADGGRSWNVSDTGVTIETSATGMHWSGALMAPQLDVAGDGTVVVTWSQEVNDPTAMTATGSQVRLVASSDDGATWTAPTTVSRDANAIMPWITAGAGDRVALTWFASPAPGDSDYVGVWDVESAVVDGTATGEPEIAYATIEERVHVGGICSRGGGCLTTGSDRALLDYFESALLPDGRLVVTYPADPPTNEGKMIDIRVAIQDGGTPLMVPGNTTASSSAR